MSRIKLKQIVASGVNLSNHGIKVGDDGQTLAYFDLSEIQSKGPLGFFASIYHVDTPSDVLKLDTTKIKLGDQVFVANDGTGQWVQYSATNITEDSPPKVTWTILATETSASADSFKKSDSVVVSGTNSSPVLIGEAKSGGRLNEIIVSVETPETNSNVSLTIGSKVDKSLFSDDSGYKLTKTGNYRITVNHSFSNGEDTGIYAYGSGNGSGSYNITLIYA